MTYRYVGRVEDRIDTILLDSARRHGIIVAARYHRLMLALMGLISQEPEVAFSRPVSKLPGLRVVHLRHGNRLLKREERITNPRHEILYRVAQDGVVEILGIVHERMDLRRAAGRAKREADE